MALFYPSLRVKLHPKPGLPRARNDCGARGITAMRALVSFSGVHHLNADWARNRDHMTCVSEIAGTSIPLEGVNRS